MNLAIFCAVIHPWDFKKCFWFWQIASLAWALWWWDCFLKAFGWARSVLWFLYRRCPSILQPPFGPLVILQYTCITQSYLGGWDVPSATHSMHPLFMYAGYHLSFHTKTAALYNGDAVMKHWMCIITQVRMLLYVTTHWRIFPVLTPIIQIQTIFNTTLLCRWKPDFQLG